MSNNVAKDNVAEDHQVVTESELNAMLENPAEDELYKFFGVIEKQNSNLTKCLNKCKTAPHDQARVAALISYAEESTEYNARIYDLVVSLNNFFVSKLK